MAYWWVIQNITYDHERAGGYLWAPVADGNNNPFHWKNMERVAIGDIVFSYVGQKIRAISIAATKAYKSNRPDEFGVSGDDWNRNGHRIDVQYREPRVTILGSELYKKYADDFDYKYSPLTVKGTGSQGYLFELPYRLGSSILQMLEEDNIANVSDIVTDGVAATAANETQRRALVLARNGQGVFRDGLEEIWHRKCCVTGLAILPILRASHSKPWKDSNNEERLDKYNGLLLSPAYDMLYDKGYITFADDGSIICSNKLTADDIAKLGISPNVKIKGINERHKPYLKYHREIEFEKFNR